MLTPSDVVYCFPSTTRGFGQDAYGNGTMDIEESIDWSSGDFCVENRAANKSKGKPYVNYKIYKEKVERISYLEKILTDSNVTFI